MPASSKAWSVGANKVNGPVPSNVVLSPTCANAASSVPCSPVPAAFVGMSSLASAVAFKGNAEAISKVIIMNVRTLFIILSHEGGVISGCFFSPKLTLYNYIPNRVSNSNRPM